MTAPSPYQYRVGGHLPLNSPSYVVRAADRQLYDGLSAGELCYVLNSRQMGKTSLRFRTMDLLQAADIACVAIDLQAIGSRNITVQQWYAGLVKRLVQGLRLTTQFNFRAWWQEQDLLSPVQRWTDFVQVLLPQLIDRPIVIFIDEIDSTLILEFDTDDFFASIRACDERDNLTFALFGVATPGDLIKDSKRSPFNVGKGIELRGFQLAEADPLLAGLQGRAAHPELLLQAILGWTGGQPFLTQKLCMFVQELHHPIAAGEEEAVVAGLVQTKIISDWEIQDEPEHLKTIHNRLHRSSSPNAQQLFMLYQEILHHGYVLVNEDPIQLELRLSGIVVKEHDRLQIYNRIYAQVFDRQWLKRVAAGLPQITPAQTAPEQYNQSTAGGGVAVVAEPAINPQNPGHVMAIQQLTENLQAERKIRKWLLGPTILVSAIVFCSGLLFLINRNQSPQPATSSPTSISSKYPQPDSQEQRSLGASSAPAEQHNNGSLLKANREQILTLVADSTILRQRNEDRAALAKAIAAATLLLEREQSLGRRAAVALRVRVSNNLRESLLKVHTKNGNRRSLARLMARGGQVHIAQLAGEGCAELRLNGALSPEEMRICANSLPSKKSRP